MHTLTNLVSTLYKINAICFGQFTLKNGETSAIYINLRKTISYPSLLENIADIMWEKISEKPFDLICGVPYTALPIATCLSLKKTIPMIMRRKEKKEYGTKQMIEGAFNPGQRCLIIEDVVTTGSSIEETAHDLKEVGLKVEHAVAFIHRGSVTPTHYELHTCLSLAQIAQELIKEKSIQPHERLKLEKILNNDLP